MNILRRSEDGGRTRRLEEETDALRDKLEKNLVALQHRVKRARPTTLGLGALLLVGLVGGVLALRSSRRGRSRAAKRHLQDFLKGVSRVAGEPQRLVRSAGLRQRALWAAAAMGASAAARQFARRALVP
jgi:hypothetical protein